MIDPAICYGYQRDGLEFIENRDEKYTALYMETGTGKTLVSLIELEKWKSLGLTPAIVVCPRAVAYNWVLEGKKWKSDLKIVSFPKGGRDVRLSTIASDFDILAVNYESLRSLLPDYIARGFRVAVLDEYHRVKSRKSKQYKFAKMLCAKMVKNLGLTGTPVTHSPLDLWPEFDVIAAGSPRHPLGYGSFTSFENSVAIVKPHPRMPRIKLYEFPDDRLAELRFRVSRHAFEATKDNCLDLPPRTWQSIPVEMGDIQRKAYWDMHRDAVSVVEGKDRDIVTTAPMIITQIMRKAQITSGFIRDDETGEIHDLPSAKMEALEELLPDTITGDRKAVVYAHFRKDIDGIRSLLEREGIPFVWVDGRNSHEASYIANEFQTDPAIKVFLGQPAVVSEGINLFAANSVFYYSNSYNAGRRWQSEDRVYRIGQERKVTYFDLLCAHTIDFDVLDNLRRKKELAKASTADLKSILLERGREHYFETGEDLVA